MTSLFIHIGTEKTGTTSAQTGFARARDHLRKQGVLYPQSLGLPNHLYLPAACLPENKGGEILGYTLFQTKLTYADLAPQLRQRFLAELHESGADKIIISNEHLHSRLRDRTSKECLRDFFSDVCDDIKIIVYLRRQDKVAVSLKSTLLKHGNVNSDMTTISDRSNLPYYFDYRQVIDSYADVFGAENIIVRIIEPGAIVNDDVIDDLAMCTGVEFPESCRPKRLNESLTAEGNLFLERLNRGMPLFVDGEPNKLRNGLIQFVETHATGHAAASITRSVAENFYQAFLDGNEEIRQRYVPDRPAPLFSEDFSSYPTVLSEGVDPEKMADLAADAWTFLMRKLVFEQSRNN